MAFGNPGDYKGLGRGLMEMRVDYGPGYRIYFTQRGPDVILLCGGDKRQQQREIEPARELARQNDA